MKYLCLVYVAGAKFDAMSPSELETLGKESMAADEELARSGHLVLAMALESVASATTVRVRGGKMSTTTGPFAETAEQLAGFVLVEAVDLNEAIEFAGRIPLARYGSVEVRPEMDMSTIVEPAAR